MAQGFCHLTKAGQEPEARVGIGDLVEAGAQQWRPAVEIPGPDEYNSFETRGEIMQPLPDFDLLAALAS